MLIDNGAAAAVLLLVKNSSARGHKIVGSVAVGALKSASLNRAGKHYCHLKSRDSTRTRDPRSKPRHRDRITWVLRYRPVDEKRTIIIVLTTIRNDILSNLLSRHGVIR